MTTTARCSNTSPPRSTAWWRTRTATTASISAAPWCGTPTRSCGRGDRASPRSRCSHPGAARPRPPRAGGLDHPVRTRGTVGRPARHGPHPPGVVRGPRPARFARPTARRGGGRPLRLADRHVRGERAPGGSTPRARHRGRRAPRRLDVGVSDPRPDHVPGDLPHRRRTTDAEGSFGELPGHRAHEGRLGGLHGGDRAAVARLLRDGRAAGVDDGRPHPVRAPAVPPRRARPRHRPVDARPHHGRDHRARERAPGPGVAHRERRDRHRVRPLRRPPLLRREPPWRIPRARCALPLLARHLAPSAGTCSPTGSAHGAERAVATTERRPPPGGRVDHQ